MLRYWLFQLFDLIGSGQYVTGNMQTCCVFPRCHFERGRGRKLLRHSSSPHLVCSHLLFLLSCKTRSSFCITSHSEAIYTVIHSISYSKDSADSSRSLDWKGKLSTAMSETQNQEYKYDNTPGNPSLVQHSSGHEGQDQEYGHGHGLDSKAIPLVGTKMGKSAGSEEEEGSNSSSPLRRGDNDQNRNRSQRQKHEAGAVPRVSSTSTLLPHHTHTNTNSTGTSSTVGSTAAGSIRSVASTSRRGNLDLRGRRMGRKSGDEEEGGRGRLGGEVHEEEHTDHGPVVRDIIIGGADGLTVPFALTAGLSS